MAMQSRYIYSGTKEHPVYVDCVKASHSSGKWPIVMLHGGFHNGSAYLSTPDGRDGWADEFARRGHDVFVMDWPGHGAYCFQKSAQPLCLLTRLVAPSLGG